MPSIEIEVAYAGENEQRLFPLVVEEGTTVGDVIAMAGTLDHVPAADRARCKLGIFGRVVSADTVLGHGDRVEVYRPLRADPKDVRRSRAARRGG